MEIGMIGLGRMGLSMSRRLLQGRHRVAGWDLDRAALRRLGRLGGKTSPSLEGFARRMRPPRTVWLMLPAPAVEGRVRALSELLEPGDLIVDGGNSDFRDDAPRAETCARRGIGYMDVGVSGGIWGLEAGYCLMAGGSAEDFRRVEPALRSLAPRDGYLHCGPVGSGHFVKMIHNGIEYGMMQSYGEGFALLRAGGFRLDLAAIAELWGRGSVVRSWLLELAARSLREDPDLSGLRGYVEDSGEARWTVREALERAVAAPVITASLFQRFLSRERDAFSNRLVAALRRQFGGHAVRAASKAGRRS